MASRIIGRKACPWCGFEHAHVKESDKCVYMYCPGCSLNGPHALSEAQRDHIKRGMRPVDSAPTPTASQAPAAPAEPAAKPAPTPTEPSATPAQPTPPKRRGLFT